MKKTYNTTGILNELKAGSAHFRTEEGDRQEKPQNNIQASDKKKQEKNGSVEPNERTVKPNGSEETQTTPSVLDEIQSGGGEDNRIPTERYSFEIYSHQKEKIEDLQYHYKKKTGKKLSASRILREAIDAYITKAMNALEHS